MISVLPQNIKPRAETDTKLARAILKAGTRWCEANHRDVYKEWSPTGEGGYIRWDSVAGLLNGVNCGVWRGLGFDGEEFVECLIESLEGGY